MTQTIFGQNQILNPATTIRWDEWRRGAATSDDIPASDNGADGISQYISFSVDPYLSGDTDYFGVNISKSRLTVTLTTSYVFSGIPEVITYFLGDDFPDCEAAQVYAQYVLWAWRQTGNFRYCPVCDLEDDCG